MPSPHPEFVPVSNVHQRLAELYDKYAETTDPGSREAIRQEIVKAEQDLTVKRAELAVETPAPPIVANGDIGWTGKFYADPNGSAAKQLEAETDPERRAWLRKLVDRSVGIWWAGGPLDRVREALQNAWRQNNDVLLVLFAAEGTVQQYRATVDAFCEVVRKEWIETPDSDAYRGVVRIVIEPGLVAGSDFAPDIRAMLTYAADEIAKLHDAGSVEGYLDIGCSWNAPEMIAERLNQLRLPQSTNLATNVARFEPTANEHNYAAEVSERIGGGRRWIIDTSRNGAGRRMPYTHNPRHVLAGSAPTLNTDHENCDAFVWVKCPGESDGEGNGGGPFGTWFEEWAYRFVSQSVSSGLL